MFHKFLNLNNIHDLVRDITGGVNGTIGRITKFSPSNKYFLCPQTHKLSYFQVLIKHTEDK